MDANSVNNIRSRQLLSDRKPHRLYIDQREDDETKKPIISGAGNLGVVGIDVPISGVLAGKSEGKSVNFNTLHREGLRQDLRPQQVTVSDMVSKIQEMTALQPNYVVGRSRALYERQKLEHKKEERLRQLAHACQQVTSLTHNTSFGKMLFSDQSTGFFHGSGQSSMIT